MDMSDYQEQAARTINPEQSLDNNLANFALGLAGEAGEVAELIKKRLFHGQPLTCGIKSELGDVLWYLAGMASVLRIDLGEIAELNLEKLHERYPEGFELGGGNRDASH